MSAPNTPARDLRRDAGAPAPARARRAPAQRRRRGAGEAGPVAAGRVGGERELRHDQQRRRRRRAGCGSSCRRRRRRCAACSSLSTSLRGLRLAVGRLGADQHQQPGPDRADALRRRPRHARARTRCTSAIMLAVSCGIVDMRLDVHAAATGSSRAARAPRSSAPARPRRAPRRRGRSVQLAGHVHVQVDEAALAGAARDQVVEADRAVREAVEHAARSAPAPRARAHGPSARRPSAGPASTPSRRMFTATAIATTGSSHSQPVASTAQQADDHAGRGPDVGEQVARVGLQRDRAVRARLAQHGRRPARR